jgi:hypothetical protein
MHETFYVAAVSLLREREVSALPFIIFGFVLNCIDLNHLTYTALSSVQKERKKIGRKSKEHA